VLKEGNIFQTTEESVRASLQCFSSDNSTFRLAHMTGVWLPK